MVQLYIAEVNGKQSKPLPMVEAMDWLCSHMYVTPKRKAEVKRNALIPTVVMYDGARSELDGIMFAYGFTVGMLKPEKRLTHYN